MVGSGRSLVCGECSRGLLQLQVIAKPLFNFLGFPEEFFLESMARSSRSLTAKGETRRTLALSPIPNHVTAEVFCQRHFDRNQKCFASSVRKTTSQSQCIFECASASGCKMHGMSTPPLLCKMFLGCICSRQFVRHASEVAADRQIRSLASGIYFKQKRHDAFLT